MSKQTAVEWLFHKLWDKPRDKFEWYALLSQAKAIEQHQIEEAWTDSMYDNDYEHTHLHASTQYYLDKYSGGEQ
jgi:hypothetical protein